MENNLQKDQIYVREFWHVDRWNNEEIVHLIYLFASSEKTVVGMSEKRSYKRQSLTSAEKNQKVYEKH